MSDWILENEGLYSERLINPFANLHYKKCADEWALDDIHHGETLCIYSGEVYQQIKSVLLFRNTEPSSKEKTLRDEFAMAAITSIASDYYYDDNTYAAKAAEAAYRIADAMLKEREK